MGPVLGSQYSTWARARPALGRGGLTFVTNLEQLGRKLNEEFAEPQAQKSVCFLCKWVRGLSARAAPPPPPPYTDRKSGA